MNWRELRDCVDSLKTLPRIDACFVTAKLIGARIFMHVRALCNVIP